MDAALLDRRLAALRAIRGVDPGPDLGPASARRETAELAEALAVALDGEVVRSGTGTYVRVDTPSRPIPIDRERLATLPNQPPPGTPLLCLDTETTGLGTATGTVVFLVGLGWWERESFRQVQLLLPDHGEERALLDALAGHIRPDAWLVTYNGRGFDWPLLVTRFRMVGAPPPVHAGHLDLLPIVRRLYRHRLEDARLRTAEAGLLGMHRIGDVDGWQIPGRYLGFLRAADASDLVDIARHNDQDVRSLARLLVHLEGRLGDPERRQTAPRGDLAGLARAFARERRLEEALECLDAALAGADPAWRDPFGRTPLPRPVAEDPWWAKTMRPDIGGRPIRVAEEPPASTAGGGAIVWTDERLTLERARLLRRLGRDVEALAAWRALAGTSSRLAARAWIEVAKLLEHRFADPAGALAAAGTAVDLVGRSRRLGRPLPGLEADLGRRRDRLQTRLRRGASRPAA